MRRHIDHLRSHPAARADAEMMQDDSMSDPDLGDPDLEEATVGEVPDSTTAAGTSCPHADDSPRPTSN